MPNSIDGADIETVWHWVHHISTAFQFNIMCGAQTLCKTYHFSLMNTTSVIQCHWSLLWLQTIKDFSVTADSSSYLLDFAWKYYHVFLHQIQDWSSWCSFESLCHPLNAETFLKCFHNSRVWKSTDNDIPACWCQPVSARHCASNLSSSTGSLIFFQHTWEKEGEPGI